MNDPFARYRSAAELGFPAERAAELDRIIERIASVAVERDLGAGGLGEDIRALARVGATAARLPASAGGAGLGYPQLVDLIVALARADSNVAQSLRSHFTLSERVARAIERGGDPAWARQIAAGDVFAGATTEIGQGERFEVATSLRRGPDGRLRITGSKHYATGTGYADWIAVLVSDEEGNHLTATVRATSPGVTMRDDWNGVGQRLTTSGTVDFDGVEVDPAHARPEGEGAVHRLGNVDAVLQLNHLATLAGIAIRARDDAVAWLRGRRRHYTHASARTPPEDPQLQERVGRIEAIAAVAASTVREAARVLDEDLARPAETQTLEGHLLVNQAQVVLPGLVLEAAQTVFDLGGGSLVDARAGFDRHWRNARTLANHNPAHLKARALGARALLDQEVPEIWYVGTPRSDAPTARVPGVTA